MALELTDSNFASKALQAQKVAVVDFWAVWCGPCRAIAPIIEEISGEYGDNVVVGKLDVDNNPEVATQYNIRSIPTILIFKDGQLVDRQVGLTTKAVLKQKIDAQLQ
jgi:thioredoxin 1